MFFELSIDMFIDIAVGGRTEEEEEEGADRFLNLI